MRGDYPVKERKKIANFRARQKKVIHGLYKDVQAKIDTEYQLKFNY